MTGRCHARWHARRLWRTRHICAIFTVARSTLYGALFFATRRGSREGGVSLRFLSCTFRIFSHRISGVYRLLCTVTTDEVLVAFPLVRRTFADETQTLGPQRLQMRCAAAEPRYAWLGCTAELSGRTSGLSSALGRPPSARALARRSRWSAGSATGIGSPTKGPSQRGAP